MPRSGATCAPLPPACAPPLPGPGTVCCKGARLHGILLAWACSLVSARTSVQRIPRYICMHLHVSHAVPGWRQQKERGSFLHRERRVPERRAGGACRVNGTLLAAEAGAARHAGAPRQAPPRFLRPPARPPRQQRVSRHSCGSRCLASRARPPPCSHRRVGLSRSPAGRLAACLDRPRLLRQAAVKGVSGTLLRGGPMS